MYGLFHILFRGTCVPLHFLMVTLCSVLSGSINILTTAATFILRYVFNYVFVKTGLLTMSSNINASEVPKLTERQGSVEHAPLFNRRPIPSPAEQPSRYAPICTEIHSQGAINAMANNNYGSLMYVRQPLPTVSWVCSCPNCFVSAQTFLKTIQNSNSMYTATICAAGPIYNQLLAATVPTYFNHDRFETPRKFQAKNGLLNTPNNIVTQSEKDLSQAIESLDKEIKSSNDFTETEQCEVIVESSKAQIKEDA